MCLTCGCHFWINPHLDDRQIVAQDIWDAADANPDLSLRDVLANLYDGMVALLNQEESANG